MRIKLVIKKAIFIFLLLLIGATTFSQLAYTFERLNTESGLPTNTIKGLQFDCMLSKKVDSLVVESFVV